MKEKTQQNRKFYVFGMTMLFSLLHSACLQNTLQSSSSEKQYSNSEKKLALQDTAKPEKSYPIVPDTNMVYIYLTFDDGPNNGTPHLLKALDKYKTPASFFIVGKHVYGSNFQKNLFEKYSNYAWLELCNHSFTHANHKYKLFYSAPEKVLADFMECHDSLKFEHKISRAPGMNMWAITGDSSMFRTKTEAANRLNAAGFEMIGWDADWDFKTYKTHQAILERLVTVEKNRYPKQYPAHHPNHLVLLLHDQSFTDSLNCKELIKFVEVVNSMPQKYCFKKISEYPLLPPLKKDTVEATEEKLFHFLPIVN